MASGIRINGERLWQSLMDMAAIGATPGGGCCRLAATDEDARGRGLFTDWVEAAGYHWYLDRMGNQFVRRPGADNELLPIRIGSHLDTQPSGGRFDGVLGVLAGLEVLRSLDDHRIRTHRPVEIVNWLNEEGARFAPPMMGSGVWAGALDEADALATVGQDGARLNDELERLGWVGDVPATHRANPMEAYLELHIEQGPVLEQAGDMIGIVTGAQAQRWYEVVLIGQDAHAGTTPMQLRRDALVGAARVIERVDRLGRDEVPGACATVGIIDVHPHSRNVVPGRAFLTIDVRHPDDATLAELDRTLRGEVRTIAEASELDCDIRELWRAPARPFDDAMAGHLRAAATHLGYRHRDMVSGAGHDAVHVATVCPAAMVFVPCEHGISHNEAENITPEQAIAGGAVLFEAAIAAAGSAGSSHHPGNR